MINYSFAVYLNSCGTQFVDEFYKGKQAYLENVLVLQNEPGIQEVNGRDRKTTAEIDVNI